PAHNRLVPGSNPGGPIPSLTPFGRSWSPGFRRAAATSSPRAGTNPGRLASLRSLGVRETTRVASLVGGTRIASLARAPGAQFNGWAKTRIVYFIGTQLEAGGV